MNTKLTLTIDKTVIDRAGFIDVILTCNVKDYAKSEIGVMTPENYIKTTTAG